MNRFCVCIEIKSKNPVTYNKLSLTAEKKDHTALNTDTHNSGLSADKGINYDILVPEKFTGTYFFPDYSNLSYEKRIKVVFKADIWSFGVVVKDILFEKLQKHHNSYNYFYDFNGEKVDHSFTEGKKLIERHKELMIATGLLLKPDQYENKSGELLKGCLQLEYDNGFTVEEVLTKLNLLKKK
ncbi:MAG: hypothetical protein GY730_06625 [bacterium]|nr:hypothetical protein [bacterium]